ncbi:hypothetical protein BJV74DRAFT_856378 [Russula compacta]|nr:hypothetical protein BJV74DRAFT_856378 [Russula compacta]
MTGYISPEELADSLSALPRLRSFTIMFSSTASHPDLTGRRPPPLTRTILPSLSSVTFRGASGYLEDLVAPISAPLLNSASILFLDQPVSDTPQLIRLISQSGKLKLPKRVTIAFQEGVTEMVFGLPERTPSPGYFALRVVCEESAWRVPLVAQLCSQSSPLLSEVERLDITGSGFYQPDWHEHMNQIQWLEIFRPFTAVGRLYISDRLVPLFVPALKALTGEGTKELLPALHSLFLEGGLQPNYVRNAMVSFIFARRLFGHPHSNSFDLFWLCIMRAHHDSVV